MLNECVKKKKEAFLFRSFMLSEEKQVWLVSFSETICLRFIEFRFYLKKKENFCEKKGTLSKYSEGEI